MKNLQDLTLFDYLTIIRRRIWYLIVTSIIVGALAVMYAKSMRPIYKSMTLILQTGRVIPEEYIRSVDRQTPEDLIAFVRQQLQSRTFLERIVHEFQIAGPAPQAVELERAMELVQTRVQLEVLSSTLFRIGYIAGDAQTAQAVARRLGEMVIQLNDSGRKSRVVLADRFLEEQYRDAEKELARTETALLEFRKQHFSNGGDGVSPASLELLRGQLSNIDNRLETLATSRKQLERRLSEQRMLSALPAPSTPQPPVPVVVPGPPPPPSPTQVLEDKLAKKKEELAAALKNYTPEYPGVAALVKEVKELETSIAESRGKAASTARGDPNAAARPAPQVDSSVDLHLIEADIRLLIDQVNSDVAKEEQARKAMLEKIATYEYQLNPPPSVSRQLTTLTRDYETAGQNYKMLKDKKVSLEMAARVDTSDDNVLFKIIDPAYLPPYPSGPNRRLYAIAGILAGVLMGFGVVFVRDYFDPTIYDEEEAATELGLPVLTSLPKVKARKKKRAARADRKKQSTLHLVQTAGPAEPESGFGLDSMAPLMTAVVHESPTLAGEQFRLLQVTLSLLQKQRGLKTLLVASAIPNDGKTFVATCLAGMLAQEPGKKVLLIDADLRSANAGSMLGIDRDTAGLTDMLRANSGSLEQYIMKCRDFDLSFLPAGAATSKPTEVLSSPEFEQHLKRSRQLFDWIVIDSPPVLALADAKAMAPLCDATILVAHCRRTPKQHLHDAIKRIGKERICGVVLNQVQKIRSTNYYDYYHRRAASLKKAAAK
jgi:succinoglycan biosynthesis transport protein ExoP